MTKTEILERLFKTIKAKDNKIRRAKKLLLECSDHGALPSHLNIEIDKFLNAKSN